MQPQSNSKPSSKTNPKWIKQQDYVQSLITYQDELTCPLDQIKYVAAVDVSFSGKFNNGACAGLLIYNMFTKKIVYEDYEYVILKEQYIPGFLAFRELGPTLELFKRLKNDRNELWPHVIMVDGNGILHKRKCGYASHLGVLLKTPSFGCAKTFYDVDGLHSNDLEADLSQRLEYHGDNQVIKGKSGQQWCTAILSDENQNKNIYVSIGTKISLQTATKLTLKLLKYESPEPVRLVDKRSRNMIKQMKKSDYESAKSYDMIFISP